MRRSLACLGLLLGLPLIDNKKVGVGAAPIPLITKVTIVNATSSIRPLVSGDTINLAITGSAITLVATANNATNSVRFGVNNNTKFRVDNAVPFTLTGDVNGGFLPWSPTPGAYNVTIQAYTQIGAKGVGTQAIFRFTVVNGLQPPISQSAPTKRPTSRPTLLPTKPPTKLPTKLPTKSPTKKPTLPPTKPPTLPPTKPPTKSPTARPSLFPTRQPTSAPTQSQDTAFPTFGGTESFAPIPPTTALSFSPSTSPANSLPNAAWLRIPTLRNPTQRNECCFVMVENLAYLIGGRGILPVDVYDPLTQNWLTPLPGLGQEFHHTQCVVIGTDIWIVAAWTGSYPYETESPFTFIFHTSNATWSQLPGLPEPRQRGAAAVVYQAGKIYVSHGNRGGHATNSTTLPWFDMYDVASGTWTILPDAPHPRDHTGGAMIGNSLCVAGGRNGTAGFRAVVLPTDCFNFDTFAWEVKPNIGQGRAGSAYGKLCDGRLMVAGGEGFGKAWNNVDIFDGSVWTSGPSLNQSRHATGLAISCTSSCTQVHIASGSISQGATLTATTETLFPLAVNVPCQPT